MANGRPVPVIMQGPRRTRQIGATVNLGDLAELTGQAERQRQAETEALLQQAILEGILPTEQQAVPVEGVTVPTQRLGDVPVTPSGRQAFTLEQLTGANIPGLTSATRQQVMTPESVERVEATRRAALTGGKTGVQALRKLLTPTPTAALKPDNEIFIKTNEEGGVVDSISVNVNDAAAKATARERGFRIQPRGATTEINNIMGAANIKEARLLEQEKALGRTAAAAENDINEGSKTARGMLLKLDQAENLLKQIETGAAAPLKKEVARVGRSLGIEIDPNLDAVEAFDSLASSMSLDEASKLKGAISDRDLELIKAASIQLGKSNAGNRLVIQLKRKIAQRSIREAGFVNEFKRKNNGLFDVSGFSEFLKEKGFDEKESFLGVPQGAENTGRLTAGLDGVPDGLPIFVLPDGRAWVPDLEE
jgi:hypothetical protein